MNKYDVVPCGPGYLAITANKWKEDAGEYNTIDPFTFCPGMRVVDVFGTIVHIKEVIPPKIRVPGQVPRYCYTVEENGNTYLYREISGELLAIVSEENFKDYLKQYGIIDFK